MDKTIWYFIIRFAIIFCLLYFGFLALLGLAVPGGRYVPFIDHYLDVGAWLRQSLMWGTKMLALAFGLETYYPNEYVILSTKNRGGGIKLVYSCMGYGVMSFWAAYILGHADKFKRMMPWLFGGLLLIWIINVFRLTAVLMSVNSNFRFPFFDHHTWFNIIAYGVIFFMMWKYHRGQ